MEGAGKEENYDKLFSIAYSLSDHQVAWSEESLWQYCIVILVHYPFFKMRIFWGEEYLKFVFYVVS